MYFDSHAHYDSRQFNIDQKELLEKTLLEKGVSGVINVGADIASSKKSVQLAETYPFIYATVGVHPHYIKKMTDNDINEMRKLCGHKKTVAIGEIGLDFYRDLSPRDMQRTWFVKQLELAEELQMPVIIHSRDAAQETFDIVKKSSIRRGVIHCYSGGLPMAMDYINLGFHIGIGGVVTFSNSKKTKEVAACIPLERLLIETDAPYLAPVPYRGKRNDSTLLEHVVDEIAVLREISPEELSSITEENTRHLFGILA